MATNAGTSIVMVGNEVTGFQAFGPFDAWQEATQYAAHKERPAEGILAVPMALYHPEA